MATERELTYYSAALCDHFSRKFAILLREETIKRSAKNANRTSSSV
jgi:hypothetical protein